jgi:hypothetical protein
MIVLLNQIPGGLDLREIIITQPTHQQRFVSDANLTGSGNTGDVNNNNINEVKFGPQAVY